MVSPQSGNHAVATSNGRWNASPSKIVAMHRSISIGLKQTPNQT